MFFDIVYANRHWGSALIKTLKVFFYLVFALLLAGCVTMPPPTPRESVDYSIPDGPMLSMISDAENKLYVPASELNNKISHYRTVLEFYVTTPIDRHADQTGRLSLLPDNAIFAIIRRLKIGQTETALAVDAITLQTYLIDPTIVGLFARPAQQNEISATRYYKTLLHSVDNVIGRINEEQTAKPKFSFILTIDMCQSTRPWDRNIYEDLIRLSDATGEPIDVGVAITGKWALWQPENFRVLKSWAENNDLSITWINHSMNHPLRLNSQGRYLFLTDPKVDFVDDVLSLEIFLLQNGITPSVWFRFPGLVFDRRTLGKLNDLSLLPLDASAWLAKTRTISDGSIVLVHGNGNEPAGLSYLELELEKYKTGLANSDVEILPVVDAAPSASRKNLDVVSRLPMSGH